MGRRLLVEMAVAVYSFHRPPASRRLTSNLCISKFICRAENDAAGLRLLTPVPHM